MPPQARRGIVRRAWRVGDWRVGRSAAGEGIAWAIIIGLVAFIAGMNFIHAYFPSSDRPRLTAGEADNLQLRMITRYFVGSNDMFRGALPEDALLDNYKPFLDGDASEFDRIRSIMAIGELIGAERALDELDRMEMDAAARAEEHAAGLAGEGDATAGDAGAEDGPGATYSPYDDPETPGDIALLRAVYTGGGGGVLTDAQRDELIKRHGWFGKLAASFGQEKTEPLRAEIMGNAYRTVAVFFTAIAVVGSAMLAGVVLFVVAIILIGKGKIRFALREDLARVRDQRAWPYVGVMAGFLVLFFAISLGVGSLPASLGESLMPFAIWLALGAALFPMMVGVPFGDLRRTLGWHSGKGILREMGAGVVGYITLLPVAGVGVLIVLVLTVIGGLYGLEPQGHPAADKISADPGVAIPLYILACIWAPVVEETMFRGGFYRYLRGTHWLAYPIVAGLVQGFFFAVIHPQGILAVPALMALGFNFAMIREWRGSLIGSMTAHALNNGFVFTMLLFAIG
ncbi:MAG: type II CAAX endopeptidase family protein [Phycisphaerales bacterium]